MRLLGIGGSPRKGNTEWMLSTLLEAAAASGADTELVPLRRRRIEPCRGCLACEKRNTEGRGACVIDDDVQDILSKMLAADVIVLATPGYMALLSGLMKTFLDRTCPVWPALRGKGLAGLAVAEEGIGAALRNLRAYGDLLEMRWRGSVTALAKLPKDASCQPGLKLRLERLGKKLAAG
jgi:multimeric flavodoxin WrbA